MNEREREKFLSEIRSTFGENGVQHQRRYEKWMRLAEKARRKGVVLSDAAQRAYYEYDTHTRHASDILTWDADARNNARRIVYGPRRTILRMLS